MLFDPKWEVEVKADPFSLENLVAWLEKQPLDRVYDYTDSSQCLLAEYFKAQGVVEFDIESPLTEMPEFGDVANSGKDFDTYGAALDRARKALAAR